MIKDLFKCPNKSKDITETYENGSAKRNNNSSSQSKDADSAYTKRPLPEIPSTHSTISLTTTELFQTMPNLVMKEDSITIAKSNPNIDIDSDVNDGYLKPIEGTYLFFFNFYRLLYFTCAVCLFLNLR